ncbi:MAG: hypothetical protein EPO00_11180 [Chloroflexota bacterium]|nr:MAG: hypothetical protein EPO00_11180 [Chloroflexota bacterium]
MTVAAFKLARDAICTEAQSTNARLAPRYRKIIDPAATAAEFTDGIAALGDFVTLSSQTTDQLAQLAVPPGLEQGQAVNLAQYRDIVAILQHELELLNAGEFADAKAVDLSTDAISRQISAWEAEYGFLNCP